MIVNEYTVSAQIQLILYLISNSGGLIHRSSDTRRSVTFLTINQFTGHIMRICGVELKANEANICLLEKNKELYKIPDCRERRLNLNDVNSRQALLDFQFVFNKLMEDYKVEKVVILQPHMKGKLAGSAVSFKLEAAICLLEELDVVLLSSAEVKASLSEHHLPVSFKETGLKHFQESAFKTAYSFLAPLQL